MDFRERTADRTNGQQEKVYGISIGNVSSEYVYHMVMGIISEVDPGKVSKSYYIYDNYSIIFP